ncbi:Protein of unknown function [Gryllus bimaculatus]|nr:Protein of unknown function [Gryllus bimaculatus]
MDKSGHHLEIVLSPFITLGIRNSIMQQCLNELCIMKTFFKVIYQLFMMKVSYIWNIHLDMVLMRSLVTVMWTNVNNIIYDLIQLVHVCDLVNVLRALLNMDSSHCKSAGMLKALVT